MKILFVTPPYHCGVVEVAGRWIPLPFVYLAGMARAAGHECVIYDAMSKWHDHDQIKARIAEEKPDVIAVSSITATLPDSIEVLQNARSILPDVITVLGGVHPHFMYEEIFDQHGDVVDLIIRGEGEYALVEALAAWPDRDALAGVKGIVFQRGDGLEVTPPRLWIPDLDALPTAFDLVDWPDYRYFVIRKSRLGAVATSRGCTHGCTFCSQQKLWEKTWRGRDPKRVVDEIADLKNRFGVNVVLFTDEYPTADEERWDQLLDLLIKADLGTYLLMETRVDDILRDESKLWKYRKAGIVHVYLGAEATDQETLDLIKKDLSVQQTQRAFEILAEHGMVTETSFVLGLPDETPEHIERTLGLSQHFNPDNAHYLAIAPWPYADMYEDLKPHIEVWDYRKYNLIDPIVKPVGMTLDDLDHHMIDCYRRFYMSKMGDFMGEKDPFRRSYLIDAARLIMSSSFIRTKMARGAGMPVEVRKMLQMLAKK